MDSKPTFWAFKVDSYSNRLTRYPYTIEFWIGEMKLTVTVWARKHSKQRYCDRNSSSKQFYRNWPAMLMPNPFFQISNYRVSSWLGMPTHKFWICITWRFTLFTLQICVSSICIHIEDKNIDVYLKQQAASNGSSTRSHDPKTKTAATKQCYHICLG